MRQSGVYSIRQKSTNIRYVGSTVDYAGRRNHHLASLRKGRHGNSKLQAAWDISGEDDFEFELLEICAADKLYEREQNWIDTEFPILFNVRLVADPRDTSRLRGYLISREAQSRADARALDRQVFLDWAAGEIAEEWADQNKPLEDTVDFVRNRLIERELNEAVIDRANALMARHAPQDRVILKPKKYRHYSHSE